MSGAARLGSGSVGSYKVLDANRGVRDSASEMIPGDPTSHARDALERAVRICGDSTDEVFLLDLARAIGLVKSNPLLARCAEDAESESQGLRAQVHNADEVVRAELVALRTELVERYPVTPDPASQGDLENSGPLIQFDALASGQLPPGFSGDRWEDDSVTADMINALQQAVEGPVPHSSGDVHRFRERINGLDLRRTVLHRELMNVDRSHAGAVWTRFRDLPMHVNPTPPAGIDSLLLAEIKASDELGAPFARVLYGRSEDGRGIAEVLPEFKKRRSELEADLRQLENEILTRLGHRASREWALRRYSERCARLRPEELQSLLASTRSARRREKLLTADAAAYLFDQGLDVWTEVSIGSSRPDLLHLHPGPGAFVVEAKIHDSVAAARAALQQGLRQLHNYVSRLQPMVPTIDGFLLMFRLGGPTVVLQPEVFVAGCTLSIISIDIAKATDSGRAAPQPVVLAPDQRVAPSPNPKEPLAGRASRRRGR